MDHLYAPLDDPEKDRLLSRQDSMAGRLQRAAYRLLMEHELRGEIGTRSRTARRDRGAPGSGYPVKTNLVAEALRLAASGIPVVPCHTPQPDGTCSCHNPDCESVGKHPRSFHGVKDATTDADTISRWWHMWPDANLGIATGGGFAVLDIDPRNGGDESLERLEAQQGEIVTKTVRTGGGGLHLYLRSAADLPNRTIAPGIEVKSKGLLVIAPPSLHVSGEIYEWIDTGEGIQVVPDWLVDLVWTNSKNDLTTPFVTHVTLPSFLDVYRPFAHIYVLKGSICHIRHRWFGSDEASTTLYRPRSLSTPVRHSWELIREQSPVS